MTGPQLNQALSTLLFGTALTLAAVAAGPRATPAGALPPVAWEKVRREAYALMVAMGESMMRSQEWCGPMGDCIWIQPTWTPDGDPVVALAPAASSAQERRP